MHSKECPRSLKSMRRMKMTLETTSYPADPHKVLVHLIYDALRTCRQSGGMAKRSIQSRIEQTYHCKLGTRFEKQLTKSLKRLVRSHRLKKCGFRYKVCKSPPKTRGWKLNDSLPVPCRCNFPSKLGGRSNTGSLCPSDSRRPATCGCPSTSRSSARRTKCSGKRSKGRRRRRRRGGGGGRARVGRKRCSCDKHRGGGGLRSRDRSRGRSRRRGRSRGGRSKTRSGFRSRSRSRSRKRSRSGCCFSGRAKFSNRSRSTSRARGRSPYRRTRSAYSSRTHTRSTSRTRRVRYKYTSRSGSRSRALSPTTALAVPVPKLDTKRGVFQPGLPSALISGAASSANSARRAQDYESARGRGYSSSRRSSHPHRSSSVPAIVSRSRSPSLAPSSRSAFPYLPSLKPIKPAIRLSAPQSPVGAGTLTPKSMVKFLTE